MPHHPEFRRHPCRTSFDAIQSGNATSEDFASLELPQSYRAAFVKKDEVDMFDGVADKERPEVAPGRRGAHARARTRRGPDRHVRPSVNYNTVWSAIFEPVPTFAFLKRLAKTHGYGGRHDLPTTSSAPTPAGSCCGPARPQPLGARRPRARAPELRIAREAPGHDDAILDPDQRVWGFECNFGGMGELCVARGDQLMPKPEHLTWEEAASMPLVNGTAYRMLVAPNGARMKQGDVVLIWGAGGGLGGFALQFVLAGGGSPGVRRCRRGQGADGPRRLGRVVINRAEVGFRFWDPESGSRTAEHRRPRHVHPRAEWRPDPTSSSSTPAATRSACACS